MLTHSTPQPHASARTPREQQAVEQLAVTTFSRGAAPILAFVFIALIVVMPAYETVQEVVTNLRTRQQLQKQGVPVADLPGRRPRIAALLEYLPLPAPASLRALEDDLLLNSAAGRWLRPWTQSVISTLGVGNRSVVFGRNGWLHYIDGVDYVTGPGFLSPEHLDAARATGRAGDPRPAILQLHRELRAIGVDLLVLPLPDKAVIVPGTLARGLEGTFGLQNRSWDAFVSELREAGVHVLDVTRAMADAEAAGSRQFMQTDTHWTPAGIDITARAVVSELTRELGLQPGGQERYRQRPVPIERTIADVVQLLDLPPSQSRRLGHESLIVHQIVDTSGRLWESTPGSDVLVIGDSFTEAWSSEQPSAASGLAEQISYYMQRPVERHASHTYGLYDVREGLGTSRADVRRAATGRRVVIWEFAGRKLSAAHWPLLP